MIMTYQQENVKALCGIKPYANQYSPMIARYSRQAEGAHLPVGIINLTLAA